MIDFETIEVNDDSLDVGDFILDENTKVARALTAQDLWNGWQTDISNMFGTDGLTFKSTYKKIIGPKEALDLLKLGK